MVDIANSFPNASKKSEQPSIAPLSGPLLRTSSLPPLNVDLDSEFEAQVARTGQNGAPVKRTSGAVHSPRHGNQTTSPMHSRQSESKVKETSKAGFTTQKPSKSSSWTTFSHTRSNTLFALARAEFEYWGGGSRRKSKVEEHEEMKHLVSNVSGATSVRKALKHADTDEHLISRFNYKEFWCSMLYESLPPLLNSIVVVLMEGPSRAYHVVNHRLFLPIDKS